MELHFTNGNRKIKGLAKLLELKKSQVVSFDLPAGWTCPCADICQSRADRITGKITDGKNCKIRCYAASIEAYAINSRKLHWENFDSLRRKSIKGMVKIILDSIPDNVKVIRVHSSGDFFNANYFNAWRMVASARPEIKIFGYTKVLDYVIMRKPDNFKLTYSFGGTMDALKTDEPTAYIVKSMNEAESKNLPLGCPENDKYGDFKRIMNGESFALVLHGIQPAKA